jgi:hypothetical protein
MKKFEPYLKISATKVVQTEGDAKLKRENVCNDTQVSALKRSDSGDVSKHLQNQMFRNRRIVFCFSSGLS